jgi:hypothetical protein
VTFLTLIGPQLATKLKSRINVNELDSVLSLTLYGKIKSEIVEERFGDGVNPHSETVGTNSTRVSELKTSLSSCPCWENNQDLL